MATLRERWLGEALQRLRVEAGLSIQDTAERLNVSDSTIQRVERAAHPPKLAVLNGLLDTYGATEEQSAKIRELWRTVKTRGWWVDYGDGIIDATYAELEDSAYRIRSYQPMIVPGLLQTEDYMLAIISAMHPDDPANMQRIEVRMRRRTSFNTRREPPQFHAVLDKAVLLRQVGGSEVMRDQIGYLRKVAERPNVTLQIVDFTVGAYQGMAGPFVIMSFDNPNYPDVAYTETAVCDFYPEGEQTVAGLNIRWDHMTKVALSPEESVSLLNQHLE